MTFFESIKRLFLRLQSYSTLELVIELALIWLVVYLFWRFVRGTRAAGAIKGILLIVVVTLGLRLLGPAGRFERLAFLFDNFLAFAAIALVVVFQPELRRALIRLGEAPFLRQTPSEVAQLVDCVVDASTFLSKNKFGAIIAIERQSGLRDTVEGGKVMNADVSSELLCSIFWPSNPLHDMGVVIRGGKILAAGVQFPLADPQDTGDSALGTRHRAAMGLTRVADALVVVVSEETGAISIAERGRLERWLTPEALQEELLRRLLVKLPDPDDGIDEQEAVTLATEANKEPERSEGAAA